MQRVLRESRFIKEGLYHSSIITNGQVIAPTVSSYVYGGTNCITYKWVVAGCTIATLRINAKMGCSPKYSLMLYHDTSSDATGLVALRRFISWYDIDDYSYTLSINANSATRVAEMLRPYNYQRSGLGYIINKEIINDSFQVKLRKKVRIYPGNVTDIRFSFDNVVTIKSFKVLRFDNHSSDLGRMMIKAILCVADVCIFTDKMITRNGEQSLAFTGFAYSLIQHLNAPRPW